MKGIPGAPKIGLEGERGRVRGVAAAKGAEHNSNDPRHPMLNMICIFNLTFAQLWLGKSHARGALSTLRQLGRAAGHRYLAGDRIDLSSSISSAKTILPA